MSRRSWTAADVHFGRGQFGKLHVRFGKAAHTSGPRPRWVPMLDRLDLVLRWFLNDVRGRRSCTGCWRRKRAWSCRRRVSALLTKEPNQVKLSTLLALCTALGCTPNDLFDVDMTPIERPASPPPPAADPTKASGGRGRSMPPQ
jgi:hypothetical protein